MAVVRSIPILGQHLHWQSHYLYCYGIQSLQSQAECLWDFSRLCWWGGLLTRQEYLVGVCLVWHLVQSGNITGGWYPLMIQCAFALQPVVPRPLSSAILHLVSCWGCPRVSIWGPQIHAGLHFLGQVPFQFFDKVAFSSQLSFQVGDCRGLQSCWFLHGSHHLCFHTAKHISDGVILTSAIDCILRVIRGMAIQQCCITSWVTHSAWLFSLRGVYDVRVINRHSLWGCHKVPGERSTLLCCDSPVVSSTTSTDESPGDVADDSLSYYKSEWCRENVYLTHLPLVPHICVSELCRHWFRQ